MTTNSISNTENTKKPPRLLFIDLARSIAIILMLIGHFITLTYKDYGSMIHELRSVGHSGSYLFDLWVKIRGFTAPLFFTISGVVFVFLLSKNYEINNNTPFWKNERIKKGLKRSILLIFCGYLLQVNLKYLFYFLQGNLNARMVSFHVLQCLGIGIFLLICIFFIHKKFKLNLSILYLLAGTTFFSIFPIIHNLGADSFFPKNSIELIQNMIRGPNSIFPLFPWIGYVFFGGFIGSLIYKWEIQIYSNWFLFFSFLFSIIIILYGRSLAFFLDLFSDNNLAIFQDGAWVYGRLGEVVLLMSILIVLVRIFKIKNSLFIKFGQNTLSIYIIHVIILYGAIIGYSLKDVLKHQLNGLESIIGAILFIFIFALYLKFNSNLTYLLKIAIQKIKLKDAKKIK